MTRIIEEKQNLFFSPMTMQWKNDMYSYCTIILQVFKNMSSYHLSIHVHIVAMKRCAEQRSYLLCVSLMIPSRILSLGSSPRSDTLFSPQSGSTIDTRLLLNAAL